MDNPFTREDLIKIHITDFLRSLNHFKTTYISPDHFKNNLLNIHKNFTKLRNVIKNTNRRCDIVKVNQNEFTEYTLGNIIVLKHFKYGFISVDSGNTEINEFLIKKRKDDLLTECSKFNFFEKTVCDYCGFLGIEIPKNKLLVDDKIMSFHDKCIDLINKKF